jgi:hypothetical protein
VHGAACGRSAQLAKAPFSARIPALSLRALLDRAPLSCRHERCAVHEIDARDVATCARALRGSARAARRVALRKRVNRAVRTTMLSSTTNTVSHPGSAAILSASRGLIQPNHAAQRIRKDRATTVAECDICATVYEGKVRRA